MQLSVGRQQIPVQEHSHNKATKNTRNRITPKQTEGALWQHDDWVQSHVWVWWLDIYYTGLEGHPTRSAAACQVSGVAMYHSTWYESSVFVLLYWCFWFAASAKEGHILWTSCPSACPFIYFSKLCIEVLCYNCGFIIIHSLNETPNTFYHSFEKQFQLALITPPFPLFTFSVVEVWCCECC